MRTKALWREGKEMGSCGALSSGDAASAVWWRCCKRCLVEMLQALPSGDAASAAWWRCCKRCLVEMLRSAAQWRCCGALLALLDEGTVA